MARNQDWLPSVPKGKRPRNTVSLTLDAVEGFKDRYFQCQCHLYYWMLYNSQYRVRYGDRLLFTTPLSGTFYYVLRYRKEHVAFVIEARQAWLIGFCNKRGFFQAHSRDIQGLYMDSLNTKVLPFNANHNSISPSGAGSTIANIYVLRRLFDVMSAYSGPSHNHDQAQLSSFFGSAVVLFMEAKAWDIFMTHCNNMEGFFDDMLGGWAKRIINNWSAASQQSLSSLGNKDFLPHDCGIAQLYYLEDLLDVFIYLHVDGCFAGIFDHQRMDPEPRILTWEKIDDGPGDGDISVPKEPTPRFNCPASSGVLRKRVTPDTRETIEDRKKKKTKGLMGGGLGGKPAAPDVFVQWIKAHKDKKRCLDLFCHLESLGLTVIDSKRQPTRCKLQRLGDPEANQKADCLKKSELKEDGNGKDNDMKKDESNAVENEIGDADVSSTSSTVKRKLSIIRKRGLHPSELASLESEQYVTGGVINFVIQQYSEELLGQGIHDTVLVDSDASYLLSQGKTTGALQMCSNSIVIFPISSHEHFDNPGGPTLWSVLVLDKWTKQGPRFIHYDSLGGANAPLAKQLATTLNPFVPQGTIFFEGSTYQPLDSCDCGLYFIAVTRQICLWRASFAASEEDWNTELHSKVSTKKIAKLRKALYCGLREHQQKDPSNVQRQIGRYSNEIDSLKPGQFIDDGVINLMFNQYSQELENNGIYDVLLADADVSFLFTNGNTAGALELCSNRLVVFPVNDNKDFNHAGGGRHWSILVLDKLTYDGPRFVHHDSSGGANSPFARQLADILCPFVPPGTYFVEAETPQQTNPYDCGVYVIAITRSICQWCTNHNLVDDKDWSGYVWDGVNPESTANLRLTLHQEFQELQDQCTSQALDDI